MGKNLLTLPVEVLLHTSSYLDPKSSKVFRTSCRLASSFKMTLQNVMNGTGMDWALYVQYHSTMDKHTERLIRADSTIYEILHTMYVHGNKDWPTGNIYYQSFYTNYRFENGQKFTKTKTLKELYKLKHVCLPNYEIDKRFTLEEADNLTLSFYFYRSTLNHLIACPPNRELLFQKLVQLGVPRWPTYYDEIGEEYDKYAISRGL